MSRETQLGANLEELYKAGTVEIPVVRDVFGDSSQKLAYLYFSSALHRDERLGIGESGCAIQLGNLAAELRSATVACYQTMDSVGENLAKTAQELATVDADTRAAFLAAGGQL